MISFFFNTLFPTYARFVLKFASTISEEMPFLTINPLELLSYSEMSLQSFDDGAVDEGG